MLSFWKPPPNISIKDWSEKYLFLPPSASPISGKYSTDFTPHVVGVFEAYEDVNISEIVLCWSAQSAKSTAAQVCMLYNMDNYQGNQIFLMPSVDHVKSYSKTKLHPMIEYSPRLKELKPSNKDLFGLFEMHMANGVLNLIGGGSATALASRSSGRLFPDEIDKLKFELKNEADPLSLLIERAKWFPDRKIFKTSTPTTEDGKIYMDFKRGTQEYYYIPCINCDHHFNPKWYKDMKWDNSDDLTNEEKSYTAYVECPSCGYHLKDKHKYKMLQKGKWVKHNEKAPSHIRSFHFSEILSNTTPWSDLVLKFLEASDKAKLGYKSELKNFVNSSLGEPWLEYDGSTVNDEFIEGLVDQDRPRSVVPNWVRGLLAGVDTQDNGFYYTVMGFGEGNTSCVISEGFVDTFENLENAVIFSQFGDQKVLKIFMDAMGHKTDEVYDFCRKWNGTVIPCVGRGRNLNSDYSWTSVDKRPGTKVIGGLQKLTWNTIVIKDILFNKLRINADDIGSFHLHNQCSTKFKQSLRSEFKNDKGVYEHIRHIENHYLDCMALAFLGAIVTNIQFYRKPKHTDREGYDVDRREQREKKPW